MAISSPLTIVITYTAVDTTGPAFTGRPIIASMTIGGTAYGSLSSAEVQAGFTLLRDASALLATNKAPADGMNPLEAV